VKHTVDAAKQQAHITLAAVATNFGDRLVAHDRIALNATTSKRENKDKSATQSPPSNDARQETQAEQKAKQESAQKIKLEEVREQLQSVLQTKELTAVDAPSTLTIDAESGRLNVVVRAVPETCLLSSGCSWRARVRLENLIPWQIVQPEFDGLLMLSEDGKLLAQDRRLPAQALGIRMSVLEGATPLDYKKVFGAAFSSPAKDAPSPGFNSPFDFKSERSIQLAGIDYLVFLQPVTVPLKRNDGIQADGSRLTFIVCGLLRKDRVRSEAIKLSPQTLTLSGSLVALGLFAIPFLKLRFIGARERMRHRDMWFLCASLLCVTALITVLMLDAHTRLKLDQRFDHGLRQFSVAVVGNVTDESDAAVKQLTVSAKEILKSINWDEQTRKAAEECSSPIAIGSILANSDVAKTSGGNFAYPDFEALYITDPCSKHWRKWMPRSTPTANVDSVSQAFYPAAIALSENEPFAFSSLIARTSGLQLGVFALPLDLYKKEFGVQVEYKNRNSIVAIATHLRSVNEPLVPQPYQFVLVNRQGEVTFQQAQGPFRGERFFEVINGGQTLERTAFDNQRLNAGDRLKKASIIRREYRGRSYRMYAIEIPNLQQTLVAYYDEAVVDSLATRIFGTAAAFTTAMIICILIGAALAVSWFGEHAHDWLWPSPARTPLYLVGCLVCVIAAVAIYAIRAFTGSYVMAGLFALAPIVTVIALGSGHITSALERLVAALPQSIFLGTQWCRSRAYQIFAVTGLVTLIAWPTALIVDDAFTMHTAAYARGVTNDLELATAGLERRFANETTINVKDPLAPIQCPNKSDQRCLLPERTYASKDNYKRLLDTRKQFGVYSICAELQRNENEYSAKDSCTSKPVPWSFTVGLANQLARFSSKPDLALTIASFSSTQWGLWALPFTSGLVLSKWTIGGILFLVGALCLLVGSVAKHVLGVGLANQLILDESQQFAPAPQTQWLLLRPSKSTYEKSEKEATSTIDLRDATLTAVFSPPSEGTTLLVQHIEHRIASAEWRNALLLLLGSTTKGCVVLCSEIDPLHYLASRLREAEEALNSADDSARPALEKTCEELHKELNGWSIALRRVRKIRTLLDAPAAVGPHQHASNATRLAIECACTEPLIEIGKRLSAITDIERYCWDDVVGFVQDAAEPYYRATWELCAHEEKLVLIQLAQEGLVNPKRIDVIQRLARRNLVAIDPRFKLMNESFRRFVQTVESPGLIADWERTPTHSAWSRLGAPLYALAAVIIAILLFTEQEMFTSIIAVATGAAGTLGSMRNLYSSAIKPVAAIVKNA
jgi:hypothetical protein